MTIDDAGRPSGLASRPEPGPGTQLAAAADVAATTLVLLMVVQVVDDPTWANLDGKAPVARAVLYPVWVLALPAFWAVARRRSGFPWVADLLLTAACLADLVGNRLDLYDDVESFDDWMHLGGTAAVTVAFVLLVVARSSPVGLVVATSLAAGATASLGWELFEFGSFLTRSTEWTGAYSDTIGDLTLGWLGAALAAAVLAAAWRRDRAQRSAHDGPSARPVTTRRSMR